MKRHSTLRQVSALLLGLVLVLRLVAAPFVIASPAPGIMAICSGGQIVYVSMQDGQPVETPEGAEADPCPFFGITSVLTEAGAAHAQAPDLIAATTWRAATAARRHSADRRAYNSRAPPLTV